MPFHRAGQATHRRRHPPWAGTADGRIPGSHPGKGHLPGILGSVASAGMVKIPGVQVIDGTPAVGLSDRKDDSRLYIALQGPALRVRIDGPGGSGSMRNRRLRRAVTLVTPPPAIDFSRVKV